MLNRIHSSTDWTEESILDYLIAFPCARLSVDPETIEKQFKPNVKWIRPPFMTRNQWMLSCMRISNRGLMVSLRKTAAMKTWDWKKVFGKETS